MNDIHAFVSSVLVNEDNYADEMKNAVEPYLASLRKDGYFEGVGGAKIHYEAYLPENARAAMVVSHGFTESAEKFREMSYYYAKAGYLVFAVDHRGHGYSHRENPQDPETVHIDNFDTYIEDLKIFVDSVVKPQAGTLPLYLYGHSMGGAISVLFIMKYADVFEKCVLTAPMISANTANLPHFLTGNLAKLFVAMGKAQGAVFNRGGYDPERKFEDSNDTSRARFDYYQAKRNATREYQTSRPSYAWVREAVRVVKIQLNEDNCRKIKAKVMLCQPEWDASVIMPPQNVFVSRVPGAIFKKFYGAKHEIYMSPNDVMDKYLNTVFSFLEA
ncbi:MAG: alpha/beta hydrolase [Clostridia bacterium]|nr:alpha/beta hydrolase [Clostridia bacterium]